MAKTNISVITDALRDLNVISETETPSAEQGAHALRLLNEMMEAWDEDGVKLGYFAQSGTGDNCPIPAWAENAVTVKLAVEQLAPTYGAEPSAALVKKYEDRVNALLRRVLNHQLSGADMSHLALGGGYYNITNGTID